MTEDSLSQALDLFRADFQRLKSELARVIVGQTQILDDLLVALIAGGHVLLEGVPGLGKTLTVRTLADALQLKFQRIQFTPDLMPADLIGTQVLGESEQGGRVFEFQQGPLFTNILLADEINRAPAKVQSALLEAMQERQVTIENETLPLPNPFMVLATQNPIEQEGVYRLPEAQLDRFLFRILVDYPERRNEIGMLQLHSRPIVQLQPVTTSEEITLIREHLDEVHASLELQEYIVDLARQSREHPNLALGASPRACISLLKASRANALLDGRDFLTHADVQAVCLPVLTHRLIMHPEAELDGLQTETVIKQIIRAVPVVQDSPS
ncbi:MAG: AAA family ATPase [Planctomycetaceae bacterium]